VTERPSGVSAVLLGLRLLAEIAMLAALAWGGWHLVDGSALSLAAAVLIPSAAAVAWGRWVAPRATHRLADPARAGIELVLFVLAFVLLTQSEPQPDTVGWGLAMLLVYLVSMPARRIEL
jgi:hypothetical protein